MQLNDWSRGTDLTLSETLDTDRNIEMLATSDQGDIVWFYINEEQAREIVRQFNRVFEMGLHT